MKSQAKRALVAAGITLAISVATALPAAAATSGSESVKGVIVASGVSGTRTVISSVAVAKGVFRGVGEIVGMPRLPTDPPNVSRADLVYPVGTMHLVSTTVGASSTVNPHSCLFRATTQEDAHIAGGTGIFANAAGTFTGSVSPKGAVAPQPRRQLRRRATIAVRGGPGHVQRNAVVLTPFRRRAPLPAARHDRNQCS
jgi:hypothetical protein